MILLVAWAQALAATRPQVDGRKLSYSTFVDLAESGRVESARILDVDAYVVGRYQRGDRRLARYNVPYLKVTPDRSPVLEVLLENRIDAKIDQQVLKGLLVPITYALPALIIVVVFIYFILSFRRGTGLFGVRSGARMLSADDVTETFEDVAGQRDAIAELRELVGLVSDTERLSELGARVPKGVLLFGPPGCGKTLLARAFASECGASFYSISGSDFVELYVGVGAARVRDLFKQARRNAPAIIFIDEIDAVGRRRSDSGAQVSGEQEQSQALNQILAEMDGFSPTEGIMVLAATNRPDVLDPALLRPGRFDRSVGLERPDEDGRLEILTLHSRSRRLDPSVDLRQIAKRAYGMTGADLANVINEAALLAGRANNDAIGQAELEEAVKRVLEAPERQRRLSMRDRSVGKRVTELDGRVTFDDVAGADEAIDELAEVRDFLVEPERFADVGAQVPRGILLFGPPGCGKSLLARALAGEANGAFFSVSATEFVERWVGVGAARVRDLFAEAKAVAPAIIFIDEIDAIAGHRGGGPDASDSGRREQDQTLNQILTELDGFEMRSGVIVVAATNRPDMLDPALLRPGRFDRQIGISPPDRSARLKILSLHAKSRQLDPAVDLDAVAEQAHGMTGADLANVVNEAALLAARAHRSTLSQEDLEEAVKRLVEAPERQRRLAMRQRSVGKRATGLDERVTFDDVAGVDDAIEELAEIKDFLSEPERFIEIGVEVPRGILLSGPPGCGKTLLAKAVAGEANAAFFSASATDFVEIWVGQGAARVRDLFAEAKAVAPAILFIDEIDGLGARRSSYADGNSERESTLNQLLVELDGFEPRSGLIVMAATNRTDMLDPALVRPGRFDREVEITMPDRAGREAILALHARGKKLADDVDLSIVAGVTPGFSGADLANIVNEAGLLAARKHLPAISKAMMEEAVERVLLGIGSRRHVMTDEERRIVAYHEAGHALVGLTLPGVTVPHKVSIIPRGRVLGYVWNVEEEERIIQSRSAMINQMAMGFGGRAAEELVIGEPGSGSANDLANVSWVARRMVCELGMSEALGGVSYTERPYNDSRLGLPGYSDEETRIIGEEVRRLIDEAHERATRVLTDSREALERIAEALLERETITADELEELVRPSSVTQA